MAPYQNANAQDAATWFFRIINTSIRGVSGGARRRDMRHACACHSINRVRMSGKPAGEIAISLALRHSRAPSPNFRRWRINAGQHRSGVGVKSSGISSRRALIPWTEPRQALPARCSTLMGTRALRARIHTAASGLNWQTAALPLIGGRDGRTAFMLLRGNTRAKAAGSDETAPLLPHRPPPLAQHMPPHRLEPPATSNNWRFRRPSLARDQRAMVAIFYNLISHLVRTLLTWHLRLALIALPFSTCHAFSSSVLPPHIHGGRRALWHSYHGSRMLQKTPSVQAEGRHVAYKHGEAEDKREMPPIIPGEARGSMLQINISRQAAKQHPTESLAARLMGSDGIRTSCRRALRYARTTSVSSARRKPRETPAAGDSKKLSIGSYITSRCRDNITGRKVAAKTGLSSSAVVSIGSKGGRGVNRRRRKRVGRGERGDMAVLHTAAHQHGYRASGVWWQTTAWAWRRRRINAMRAQHRRRWRGAHLISVTNDVPLTRRMRTSCSWPLAWRIYRQRARGSDSRYNIISARARQKNTKAGGRHDGIAQSAIAFSYLSGTGDGCSSRIMRRHGRKRMLLTGAEASPASRALRSPPMRGQQA